MRVKTADIFYRKGRHFHFLKPSKPSEVKEVRDELKDIVLSSPKKLCEKYNIQNCDCCNDIGCCDNTSPVAAEVKRLRKECAARRQDCKRLRKERDELVVAMKDIVAIWEAHEGTEEEDGERMASLAEEMSNKWET